MIRFDVNTQQLIVSDLDFDTLEWMAGLVLAGPLLIIGPPGVGKTAMATDIAQRVSKRMGRDDCIICQVPMPQVSIVDLYVPVPYQMDSGWVITYALSQNLHEAFEKARNGSAGVIVLDDITLAPAEMQPPVQAMTDVGEKTLGGHRIPPTLKIVATGNPESWGGESLLASLRTRVAIVNYLPDPHKWASRFLDYWGKAGQLPSDSYPPEEKWRPWRQRVSEFIKSYPSFLYTTEPSKAGEPSPPSPRGWDLFSRALAWNDAQEYETIRLTGTAYLPARMAEAFAGFVVNGGMISPEEVFANIQLFVDRAEKGEFSSSFPLICQNIARYVLDNLHQQKVVDAAFSLAQELQNRKLHNLYVVYASFLLDIARSPGARQLAQNSESAANFIKKASNLIST